MLKKKSIEEIKILVKKFLDSPTITPKFTDEGLVYDTEIRYMTEKEIQDQAEQIFIKQKEYNSI